MTRTVLFTFLVCLAFSFCYGQDTIKKTAPAKSALKNQVGQPHYYHHYSQTDSAARAVYRARRRADSAYEHPTDKSLNSQYQYLLSRVYHYQQPLISALWQNASDTLNENRKKLKAAEAKVTSQSKLIDSLQNQLQNNTQSADTGTGGISILGLTLSKSAYNLTVWGIVAALVLILVIVTGRSSASRREARYRIQLYSELEEEFKAYKTKANDKEIKLARELQTERNKLDELLGRG